MKIKAILNGLILMMVISSILTFGSGKVKADNAGGWVVGTWSGALNTLNLSPTLQGDMLFGYNNSNRIGKWSHVALVQKSSNYDTSSILPKNPTTPIQRIYGWDGLTVEATTPSGVYKNYYQSHFKRYDAATITTVNLKIDKRLVISKAMAYKGSYTVLTSYYKNDLWYCTKLASRAYYDVTGSVLGGDNVATWPETLYYDKRLVYVSGSKSSKYDGRGIYAASANASIANPTNIGYDLTSSKIHSPSLEKVNIDAETKSLNEQRRKEAALEGKQVNYTLRYTPNYLKPGFADFLTRSVKEGKINLSDSSELNRLNISLNDAKSILNLTSK
ncbi:hypothetical protein AB7942_29995 [Neobacillus sp. BF23-41]|uniref:hypothetical protein n=1 Tax=Neobacillus sp. BF23-41 TaxID=3240280 RepID=UPI0034E50F1D